MRFVVSGGSGFVGRALIERLAQSGNAIVEIGRSPSRGDIDQFFPINSFSADTSFKEALDGCEVIIHLAARVHVMHEHAADPLSEFLKVNLHGTTNLARQAAAAGVKRFVYVSSIKVNGEHTKSRPFTEADKPHPQDAYAISKWEAEQALQSIARDSGMEAVIVRPPLVYGPSVKANFVKLLQLVDRGVPLPLAKVRNSRSLVYVGNMVDALIACATHPAAAEQTYLISDGEDVSTPQLIDAVAKALHRPSRIFPVPIPLMRAAARLVGKSAAVDRLTQSLVIDSSKIRNELDWQPLYTMAQGLQATAEWYRSNQTEAVD